MHRDFSETAALFSDPARASMLLALVNGIALPAGQLAMIANVSPQTASSHLSKLIDGRVLSVEQQGRHRYFRLANAEVATAIETLLAISPRVPGSANGIGRKPELPGSLVYARTCYSHLAGKLAVNIADTLEKRRILVAGEDRRYRITAAGRKWLEQFGIAVHGRQMDDPRFARRCLDWTERRHHIAGGLGSALLDRFRDLKWIAPMRGTRAVRVTIEGRRELASRLGVQVPILTDCAR